MWPKNEHHSKFRSTHSHGSSTRLRFISVTRVQVSKQSCDKFKDNEANVNPICCGGGHICPIATLNANISELILTEDFILLDFDLTPI